MTEVAAAVERGDLDELLRLVDACCERRDWAGLRGLRDRCERALERGRQLWPAVHHAEYRLALEAPGEWAGPVLVEGAGRFAPGPLAEVAASTHAWSELAAHVPPTPAASLCAHECVVRGEDLRGVELPGPDPIELPLVLQEWEPRYAVAAYRAHTADFPAPEQPPLQPLVMPARFDRIEPGRAGSSLLDLVRTWSSESEATVEVAAVRGDLGAVLAALGRTEVRAVEVDPALALAWMAWAAASGGVRGRRRGAATGRLDAWLAAAALTGVEGWPPPAPGLGTALGRLRWWIWDGGGVTGGWALRLAAEDPERALAWAIAAHDPA